MKSGALFVALFVHALIFIKSNSSTFPEPENDDDDDSDNEDKIQEEKFDAHNEIIEKLKADNIMENLKTLSSVPSIAGTPEAKEQAEYTRDLWIKYGMDKVKIHKYNVLLSYPVKPANITMYDEDGKDIFKYTINKEKTYTKEEKDPRTILPFNAYSPSADVEGDLVYANYGDEDDFLKLKEMGVNIKGKILLMRYAHSSRGVKVQRAQQRGAIGCILYSDPQNYAPTNRLYPNGMELPETGLQIGTIMPRKGDALSRGYPAKDGLWRVPVEKVEYLPKIPSQPIPVKYARRLLKEMSDGVTAPSFFQGDFGFKYKVNTTKRVRIQVETKLESRPTYSVSGTIFGDVEPDRLTILGNHRDSWNFGAADATSGSAVLLEVARALGEKKKEGWRPRRSIMLCSWDAEEFGIMGSTEWTEEFGKIISERAVAYLNVDIAVEGNYTVRLKTTPQLDDAFFEATKELRAPDSKDLSIFEDWLEKTPSPTNENEPQVTTVTSGSDYRSFVHVWGVPSLDIRYFYNKKKWKADQYSMYHSVHDNFKWIQKYIDHDFRYHLAVGQMWTKIALILSDSSIIPFNLMRYTAVVLFYAQKFKKDHMEYLEPNGISLDLLVKTAKDLNEAAEKFHQRLDDMELTDPLKIRMINDQMMQFERAFISETGISGRKDTRHVIFATTIWVLKRGNKFPGLMEATYKAYHKIYPNWDEVKRELSVVIFQLQTAIKILDEGGLKYVI